MRKMTEDTSEKRAQEAYDALRASLDGMTIKYKESAGALYRVEFEMTGKFIPMKYSIVIDPARQVILMFVYLLFRVPEDRREDVAVVTSFANFMLADGSFDFDIDDGSIVYRMASSFKESLVGKGLFDRMLTYAFGVADRLGFRMFVVSRGMMTPDEFAGKD